MKFLLAVSVSLFAFGALAQEDLNSMKRKANDHIDKKMSTLQDAKTCINSANSMEKYKACKYDLHKEMKMQKMEKMEEHKDEMESKDE